MEIPSPSLKIWGRKSADSLFSAINLIIFLFLDFLDRILCHVYRLIDSVVEEEPSHCYCDHGGREIIPENVGDAGEEELSESLYWRENVFREMGVLKFSRKHGSFGPDEKRAVRRTRWSDCGCEGCISWMGVGERKLHAVVKEPSREFSGDGKSPIETVIFLHGFLSSSSLWTELVFPRLSQPGSANYRLIAVDLFGFGKSPKPRDSLYTLRDHIEMIEKSVIEPFQLDSFHIVAHSMGCVLAVALASKYAEAVKSVVLTAPPYFPASKGESSLLALRRLAEKRVWPPLVFGSSVMSWYEHLGRSVCFLICRNHRTWERILKFVTRRSDLHFGIVDLTRHTHHSAWHTMHNVICGGMKFMDGYLETLKRSNTKIYIVHGDRDQVVPLECSIGIKAKFPGAEVDVVRGADHNTVLFGRESEFVRVLEGVWDSCCEVK